MEGVAERHIRPGGNAREPGTRPNTAEAQLMGGKRNGNGYEVQRTMSTTINDS